MVESQHRQNRRTVTTGSGYDSARQWRNGGDVCSVRWMNRRLTTVFATGSCRTCRGLHRVQTHNVKPAKAGRGLKHQQPTGSLMTRHTWRNRPRAAAGQFVREIELVKAHSFCQHLSANGFSRMATSAGFHLSLWTNERFSTGEIL